MGGACGHCLARVCKRDAPTEEGINYYVKWVKDLRSALSSRDDVLGLTDQLRAMQWVLNLLERPDGQAYALERSVQGDDWYKSGRAGQTPARRPCRLRG